jgi:hypothetical protein
MLNDNSEIIAKISKPIGKEVSFRFPGNEGHKHGVLKERVIIPSNPGTTGVPYWDVVDLISFPDERESDWIRIGYYRKPKNRLVWGSQTTITEPISTWKRILLQAAREKIWFHKLIREVTQEL